MRKNQYVLMSIKPIYAEMIKNGQKNVELRRVAPKIQSGDILIIYESSPIKKITSYCYIDSIVIASPQMLWNTNQNDVGIDFDSFMKYFAGRTTAIGIRLKDVHVLDQPIDLDIISVGFRAPQSYRYLTKEQFSTISSVP